MDLINNIWEDEQISFAGLTFMALCHLQRTKKRRKIYENEMFYSFVSWFYGNFRYVLLSFFVALIWGSQIEKKDNN